VIEAGGNVVCQQIHANWGNINGNLHSSGTMLPHSISVGPAPHHAWYGWIECTGIRAQELHGTLVGSMNIASMRFDLLEGNYTSGGSGSLGSQIISFKINCHEFYATNSWIANPVYHSDIRSKKDVIPDHRGLEIINQLQPITYDYYDPSLAGRRWLGFSAQEVAAACPEAGAVAYYGNSELCGYCEVAIVAALVNAVKELSAKVAALEARRN